MCHPFGMNLMYLFLCGLRNLSFVDVYVVFTCCLADSSGTIFSLLNAVLVHSKISFVKSTAVSSMTVVTALLPQRFCDFFVDKNASQSNSPSPSTPTPAPFPYPYPYHVTPLLLCLHWLPVVQRIQYKLSLLFFS